MEINMTFFESRELWSPTEEYTNHRIPGMLVTRRGTLLVYCEARCSASDWGMMDILLQRSENHGESFGAPILIAKGNEKHKTVNNPVMLEDKNGRIHFLYCEDYTVNGGRALRRYSDDDGLSWSEPIEITEYTRPDYRNVFAFGPGHGIVTEDGTLVVPVWMVPRFFEAPLLAHNPSVISTFYSTDNGESWAMGELLETKSDLISPNETVAAPTSDGRVYLNIRFRGYCRAKAYSQNGYSDWQEYRPDYTLPDPQCFGSVAAYDDGKHPYTLIFANCADKEKRANVTVRASLDDGESYSVSKLIDKERGGYVEVAVDNKAGLIYLLYEDKFGETCHLVRFNYEWLFK